ncbi:MAG: hypothetical protein E6J00_13515 [Chloroflexi bacterium]|nr:MAG: hypothetical protein E6J00_13515 [Chloroflexota bacterium]
MAPADGEDFAIIGRSLTKPDAMAKVSGQTRFADDLALPRMLYGRLLRSPNPHARILSLDVSRARALPGVFAVLTGEDPRTRRRWRARRCATSEIRSRPWPPPTSGSRRRRWP